MRGEETVPDRDPDREWRTIGVTDAHHGQHLGIGFDPVLLLPSCPIDALVQVSPAIEQADADERQPLIGRLLQQITGEHPEPSRVHRQRPVHAELGAQERDRPTTEVRPGRASKVGIEHLGDHVDTGEVLAVGCGLKQRTLGQVSEEANGILTAQREAVGPELPEELSAARCPRPAVVVGDPSQGVQRLRQPTRQAFDGYGQVARAVEVGIAIAKHGHRSVNLMVRRDELTSDEGTRPLDRRRLGQDAECTQCRDRLLRHRSVA